MISRNNEKGFFAAHWDWLVAALGGALLIVAALALFLGGDTDDMGGSALGGDASLRRQTKTAKSPVPETDMTSYAIAKKLLESPAKIVEPPETQASFLASDRRVFCEQGDSADGKKSCGAPIPFGAKTCPFCGASQPQEKKVALDSDGDGVPDDVEKKWGMNPNDPSDINADKDGDGFTNIEEIRAKTDPTDPASHPDYLDSLKVTLPLKETFLPFHLERVLPVGAKHRFTFRDSKRGEAGTYSVLTGEAIAFKEKTGYLDGGKTKDRSHDTGFIVEGVSKKDVVRKIKGGMTRKDQVSVATIKRVSDGRTFKLEAGSRHEVAVDVQAKLVYTRNGTKEFTVVPGDTIDLNGTKYKVTAIVRDGKTARVTLDGGAAGKKTLEALEP